MTCLLNALLDLTYKILDVHMFTSRNEFPNPSSKWIGKGLINKDLKILEKWQDRSGC